METISCWGLGFRVPLRVTIRVPLRVAIKGLRVSF